MRLVTAAERLSESRAASHRLSYAARLAIADRQMAPYIKLKCGHLTTREEIAFFSVWQTKPHRYYCTQAKCQTWVDEIRPEKIAPIEPDELPF